MCGIIGGISLTPINKEQFLNACNIQAHRGPDDSGLYETKIGVSVVWFEFVPSRNITKCFITKP